MPGEEVGVQVREHHVRDAEALFARGSDVLLDVALRIDDDGLLRRFVADQVRRVGQAIEVELAEDHRKGESIPDGRLEAGG